jgi:hypothetical protein
MEKAKRARKAETPRQPSLCLRLRAPYLYPDPTATLTDALLQGTAAGTSIRFQLDRHPAELASEIERRRIAEVDR